MHKKLILTLICLLSALCITTISNAEDATQSILSHDKKAVLRSLHSHDIRRIMRRLNTLAYEREFTQLDLIRLRRENLEALADAAADLVTLADQLPALFSENQLSEEERVTFKAMANQLQKETLDLLDSTSTDSYREQEAGYRKLSKTCMACHNLFRDN